METDTREECPTQRATPNSPSRAVMQYPHFNSYYFKRFGAIKQYSFTPNLLASRCSPDRAMDCPDITMVTQLT